MTDELAARRKAVLARLQAARDEAAARCLADTAAVDHVGEQIEASKRAHPSNPRVYDREGEA
jgi:hypothetical protein